MMYALHHSTLGLVYMKSIADFEPKAISAKHPTFSRLEIRIETIACGISFKRTETSARMIRCPCMHHAISSTLAKFPNHAPRPSPLRPSFQRSILRTLILEVDTAVR